MRTVLAPKAQEGGILAIASLLSGFAAGVVAGFALQLVLAQLVFALGFERGWEAGGLLLVAGAAAVLVVPALRRMGAGFFLGLVLGGVAQFAFVTWWI